jgi:hypothetical protein
MISKEELIKQISNTIGKTKVLELSRILKDEAFALRDLIDLTFYADRDIAFRAVWILENVFLKDPLIYETDVEYLISRIKDVKHASCKRHYAKIMMHITAKKAPPVIRKKLQQINLEPVVEQCFDWMIDPRVLVAVKIFSSEALFNLSERYPWIKAELADQVSFLLKNGTAAMQSMGKALLAKLSLQ